MHGTRRIVGLACLATAALALRVWIALHAPADETVATAPLAWQMLQCLLGTAIVPAVAGLGWSLLPDRPLTGWLAALVAAVYPPHLLAVTQPGTQLAAALVLTLLLLSVVAPKWRATHRGAIAAGCLAGMLVPLEPLLAVAVPVCIVVFWLGADKVAPHSLRAAATLRRVGLLTGLATVVLLPWAIRTWSADTVAPPAHIALAVGGDFVPVDDSSAAGGPAEAPSPLANSVWSRLKAFSLFAGSAAVTDRLSRLAAVAWLVMGGIGAAIALPRWRQLWAMYIIFFVPLLLIAAGYAPPALRMPLEPLTFLWVAWSVTLTLSRTAVPSQIRVYRPGEQAADPLDGAHVLRGPHYREHQHRRAG